MMKLTERMTVAAKLSGVIAAEVAWDEAREAVQAGTLDQIGFDLVHSRLQAAQDRYVMIMRQLRSEA